MTWPFFAPKERPVFARGGSPWTPVFFVAPKERPELAWEIERSFGASIPSPPVQGLPPLANIGRSFGAKKLRIAHRSLAFIP